MPLFEQLPQSGGAATNVTVTAQSANLATETGGNLAAIKASVGANAGSAPTSSVSIGTKDVSGNIQPVSAANPLPITGTISASNPSVGATGSAAPTSATELGFISGANLVAVSASNALPVTANAGTNLNTSALALETGGNLAAINTNTARIPAQGQALAAASLPVVLTALQVATLTPPAAITNYANETGGNLATLAAKDFATQTTLAALNTKVTTVNTGAVVLAAGTAEIGNVKNSGTFAVQSTLQNGANIVGKVGIDQTTDGTTNLVAAKQNGSWNINNISGTVSLPTGAATALKQPALGTAGTASTDVLTMQGIAGGTPLPVSGTVTANNPSVSATGSAVPASATYMGVKNGANIVGLTEGQSTMANSLPMAIASDQSTINVLNGAATTGGYTPGKLVSAATTNATSIKGSAGTLGYIICTNVASTMAYLKFYNKASAPTVGTDVPVLIIPIPGNTAGAGSSFDASKGVNFTTGIAFAITGLAADSDTTAVGLNNVTVSYGTI